MAMPGARRRRFSRVLLERRAAPDQRPLKGPQAAGRGGGGETRERKEGRPLGTTDRPSRKVGCGRCPSGRGFRGVFRKQAGKRGTAAGFRMRKALYGTTQKRRFCRGPSAFSCLCPSPITFRPPHQTTPTRTPTHPGEGAGGGTGSGASRGWGLRRGRVRLPPSQVSAHPRDALHCSSSLPNLAAVRAPRRAEPRAGPSYSAPARAPAAARSRVTHGDARGGNAADADPGKPPPLSTCDSHSPWISPVSCLAG